MVRTFLEWKEEDIILTFLNENTEERFQVLSAKRGNSAYAKKKRKKAWEINQGLVKLNLDFPVYHAREVVKDTHLLLITLTFDQKLMSKDGAWHLMTSKGEAFNRFSANVSKIFGTKATWKVKEGTGSGYPAPHILIILDRPVRVFRYKKNWRLQSRSALERLRRAWPYGFIDVRGVVSGKVGKCGVVSYLTKYLTKSISVNINEDEPAEQGQWDREKTAILTHVWNKVFKCRDVLSKAFKDRLNRIHPARPEATSDGREWSLSSMDHYMSIQRIVFHFRIGHPQEESGCG